MADFKKDFDKTKSSIKPAAGSAGKNAMAITDNRSAKPIQQKENNTGLPDNLKSGVENLSGFSMDDVKVHYNSDKPAQLNAHAYAQGTDIHVASGQEKHLPHEAWHVVQQKQGRVKPTMQMQGRVNVNDDKGLEKEADVMGWKASQMKDRIGMKVKTLNPIPTVQLKGKVIQRLVVSGLKKGTMVIIIETGEVGIIESEIPDRGSYNVEDNFAEKKMGEYKYEDLNLHDIPIPKNTPAVSPREAERNFKEYRAERAKHDEINRIKKNLLLQNEYKFRFYRTIPYKGTSALIAAIIDIKFNPHRTDYGRDLIDGAIKKMEGINPPSDISPDDLINTNNLFKAKVIDAYNKTVKETDGKTDTQLGLRADNVTYK